MPYTAQTHTYRLIPLSVLALDLPAPSGEGWPSFLASRGIAIVPDDLGRPSDSSCHQPGPDPRTAGKRGCRGTEPSGDPERQAVERDQQFRAQSLPTERPDRCGAGRDERRGVDVPRIRWTRAAGGSRCWKHATAPGAGHCVPPDRPGRQRRMTPATEVMPQPLAVAAVVFSDPATRTLHVRLADHETGYARPCSSQGWQALRQPGRRVRATPPRRVPGTPPEGV